MKFSLFIIILISICLSSYLTYRHRMRSLKNLISKLKHPIRPSSDGHIYMTSECIDNKKNEAMI